MRFEFIVNRLTVQSGFPDSQLTQVVYQRLEQASRNTSQATERSMIPFTAIVKLIDKLFTTCPRRGKLDRPHVYDLAEFLWSDWQTISDPETDSFSLPDDDTAVEEM